MISKHQLHAFDHQQADSLPDSGTSSCITVNPFQLEEKTSRISQRSSESHSLLIKETLQPESLNLELWTPPHPHNGRNELAVTKLSYAKRGEKSRALAPASPKLDSISQDLEACGEDSRSDSRGCGKSRKAWKQGISHFLGRLSGGVRSYMEKKTEDADGAEVERQTLRYMPESVDRLLALTNFDRRELKTLYRNFKNECPNGVVNEETFKSIYCQFFPNGDADMYAHYVFRAFDSSEEDHLNFEEFAIGLSSLLRGSLVDRLQWTFRLYDINHDGYITREEMLSVIKSVYQLLGAHVKPAVSDENYLEHTDRIFTKLDVNGDGLVTMEEFCDTCSKDESIVHSMSIFDHAL